MKQHKTKTLQTKTDLVKRLAWSRKTLELECRRMVKAILDPLILLPQTVSSPESNWGENLW